MVQGGGEKLNWLSIAACRSPQKAGAASLKHLDYSRRIFLKLLEISRSLDESVIAKLQDERDYEELNYYILSMMLK